MKNTFSTIAQTAARKTTLTLAGLAFAGGAIAGPAVAAQAAPASTGHVVTASHDDRSHDNRSAREVRHDFQAQPNFYYCGPAATRIALSATGKALSQDEVAKKLGTTVEGTPSAEDTTRVLNSVEKADVYKTTAIPDATASRAQIDKLQADVMRAIDSGRPVVANIIGTATDTDGVAHSYAGGHYLTVVGYSDGGRTVKISDPANVNGLNSYEMSTIDLANWIATRGYSA